MKKKILSILLAVTLVLSSFSCISAVSVGAAVAENVSVSDGSPKGWFDSVEGGENSITVRGWAFDQIDTSQYTQVHIYIGGASNSAMAEGHAILANTSRPDVDDAYGCGDNHGFEATISTEKIGAQIVYAYAISLDQESHMYLGAKAVNIGGEDKIKPVISDARIPISHSTQFTVSCNVKESNLSHVNVYAWYSSDKDGTQKGYQAKLNNYNANCTIPIADLGGKNGSYTVHIYAYDTSNNYDVEEIIFDFYNPTGSIDSVVDNGNSIKISGWAFDESDVSKPIELNVYIGGDAGTGEKTTIIADKLHTEADKLYGCGENHGFDAVIPTTKTGMQDVYVYMSNVGTGGITLLDKFSIAISLDTEKPVVNSLTAVTGEHAHECVITAEISDNIGAYEVILEAWDMADTEASPLWCFATVEDGVATGTLNLNTLNGGKNGSYLIQARAYDYAVNYDIKQIEYELYQPQGAVEVLEGTAGGVKLEGWAFDGNDLDEALEIAVYIGGAKGDGEEHIIVADKSRADIDEEYGCGENHGFSETIRTDLTGNKIVFVYATNIGNGKDVILYAGGVTITEIEYETGDVNLDGILDVNDVTYMQMHLAGYKKADGSAMIDTENEEIFNIANVNSDSQIDISDVTYIQMMLAGLF